MNADDWAAISPLEHMAHAATWAAGADRYGGLTREHVDALEAAMLQARQYMDARTARQTRSGSSLQADNVTA